MLQGEASVLKKSLSLTLFWFIPEIKKLGYVLDMLSGLTNFVFCFLFDSYCD